MTTTDVIFGDLTLPIYFGLLLVSVLGASLSAALELLRHWDKVKSTGGFSLGKYIGDNGARLAVTVFIVAVGLIFADLLFGEAPNRQIAFFSGFATDKFIEALYKRRKEANP